MKKRITLYLMASIALAIPALTLSMDPEDIFHFDEPKAVSGKTPVPFRTSEETGLGTALSDSAKAKRRAQVTQNCRHIAEQSRDADAAQTALLILRNSGSGHNSPFGNGSGQASPDILSPRTPDHHSPLQRSGSFSDDSSNDRDIKEGAAKIISQSSDKIKRLASQGTVHITCPDGTQLPNETKRFDTPAPSPSASQKRLQLALSTTNPDGQQPGSTITQPSVLPTALSKHQSPAPQPSDSAAEKTPGQPQPDATKKPVPTTNPTSIQQSPLWMELTKAGISIVAFLAFLYYMKWLPDNTIQVFDTGLSKLKDFISSDTYATEVV